MVLLEHGLSQDHQYHPLLHNAGEIYEVVVALAVRASIPRISRREVQNPNLMEFNTAPKVPPLKVMDGCPMIMVLIAWKVMTIVV
ncbi:hypothetical protein AEQ67_12445 [Pseudomonas sp. RIT-PI-q]|nr:hypothetical protein AEQ67_12445 [Pseudomonas sp. RIT-PI-q]